MKKYWGMRILGGIVFGTAAIFVFGFVTMKLWNGLVPDLFHGPVITLCQAFGILILGKILFGGFRGGCGWGGRGCCGSRGGYWGGHGRWREKWEQKMANMTPEEKEKYKQAWRNRCGPYYSEETGTEEEKK
jgi:hypothetical protein